ncbi:hypothetical protein MNVI_44550 [Mycobacterium noviomagense]|uniref:Uncharacterized protein n=1 Tax=Mycobacterium noviomagense TaxID=459858 RepID=A0A7I7PKG9_9MYCO|nr:hypothetical protein MNVI_44550 [Mycobacterium noviomagense]
MTVPSVTLSPRAGIWTEKAISVDSSIDRAVGVGRPLAYHTVVYRGGTQLIRNHPVTAKLPADNQGGAAVAAA